MDDRHVEDRLRRSWKPEPPDGMRERVLRRAHRELAPGRGVRSFFALRHLKPALAVLALLALLLTGSLEQARSRRLAALIGDGAAAATHNLPKSDFAGNRRMDTLFALKATDGWGWNDHKGDDRLWRE